MLSRATSHYANSVSATTCYPYHFGFVNDGARRYFHPHDADCDAKFGLNAAKEYKIYQDALIALAPQVEKDAGMDSMTLIRNAINLVDRSALSALTKPKSSKSPGYKAYKAVQKAYNVPCNQTVQEVARQRFMRMCTLGSIYLPLRMFEGEPVANRPNLRVMDWFSLTFSHDQSLPNEPRPKVQNEPPSYPQAAAVNRFMVKRSRASNERRNVLREDPPPPNNDGRTRNQKRQIQEAAPASREYEHIMEMTIEQKIRDQEVGVGDEGAGATALYDRSLYYWQDIDYLDPEPVALASARSGTRQ